MNYLLKCLTCGLLEWVSGEDDPDTNSFELNGDLSCTCDTSFEVVDSEYEGLVGDEVI